MQGSRSIEKKEINMIDTSNHWIGDIIAPLFALFMLGASFWYAWQKDKIAHSIKKRHTCNDLCHGSNDNYIYKHFDALEAAHALEQRVKKIEDQLKDNNARITIN